MLSDPNRIEFLKNAFLSGRASLFLGAGFCKGLISRTGEPIPDGNELIKVLWNLIPLPGEPGPGESLQTTYELALKKVEKQKLRQILTDRFTVTSVPQWMRVIPKFIWRKIFTTNIDNVVETIYVGSEAQQRLVPVDAITRDYFDRDQTFTDLTKVALHGTVEGLPDNVTFGVLQYASRVNRKYDPWYNDFIYEYCNFPMIFVGSQLDEPVLWQYIEARGDKFGSEQRPKSFIVTPSLSAAKAALLDSYNITHIPTTGENFFNWLESLITPRPTKKDIIRVAVPNLIPTLDSIEAGASQRTQTALSTFFLEFRVAKPHSKDSSYRKKVFYSGASPTWQDIAHELDAPRDISSDLLDKIRKKPCDIFLLHGTDGSGKSTIARRIAWTLSGEGLSVFFNESGQLPDIYKSIEALKYLKGHPILIIDDTHNSIGQTKEFVSKISEHNISCTLLFISRSSKAGVLIDSLKPLKNVEEVQIGDLSRAEIEGILQRLETNGMLGRLQGLTSTQRIREFEVRAKKQILVALKEATNGQAFNDIIKGEYQAVDPKDAQKLYLLASLVTSHGHAISKAFLFGAFGLQPSQCQNFLQRELRNLVVDPSSSGDRFLARHQMIADLIVGHIAERIDLLDCYIEILEKIGHTIGDNPDRKSKAFRLYKSLINHDILLVRFENDTSIPQQIYEHIRPHREKDYHFWLQYSHYELSRKDYDLAQTYIDAAASLCDSNSYRDPYVELTQAAIGLNRSIWTQKGDEAKTTFKTSTDRLEELISSHGSRDGYGYHVLATGLRHWANLHETEKHKKLEHIKRAKRIAERGLSDHQHDRRLKELWERLVRDEYLVGAGKDLETTET